MKFLCDVHISYGVVTRSYFLLEVDKGYITFTANDKKKPDNK